MEISVMLNGELLSGIKSADLFVLSARVYKPKSIHFDALASIPCKYGDLLYQFTESSYNLVYGKFEVDIDYTKDYINGYILKCALYQDGDIVDFLNYNCNDLASGIVNVTEKMIEKHIT